MRPLPRILAGAVALAALSLAASACDTSPVAASVNGQVVKQTALNAELGQLSANRRYIAAIDDGSDGATVAGVAPGTYNSSWTAHVLTGIVTADAVHQKLAARHDLPSAVMLTAASAVNSANYQTLWAGFSASYRTTLSERTADLATLEAPTAATATIASAYKDYAKYFFSSVCVEEAAVTVTDSSGGVDYPASASKASALATSIDAGTGSSGATGSSGVSSPGSVTCYTPAELADQSQSLISTVLGLDAGKAAAPQKASFGYQVVAVTSRATIPLDSDLTRALSVVLTADTTSPTVNDLLAASRVTVDPEYGTWTGTRSAGYAVKPLTPPKS